MYPNCEKDFWTRHEENVAKMREFELYQRVTSWLNGIEAAMGGPETLRSTTRKSRQYAPYARRLRVAHRDATHAPGALHNPAATLDQVDKAPPGCRSPSLIKLLGDEFMPDPRSNLLITTNTKDLEEEYCRVILSCNVLESKKQSLESRWLLERTQTVTQTVLLQELMDVGSYLQRARESAQYIVDYTHANKLTIDFATLFSRYFRPPPNEFPKPSMRDGIDHFDLPNYESRGSELIKNSKEVPNITHPF
ncbi:hypothetical protein B0H34DRAFT_508921 [Crassisporium funariophilum]|nr:hypothetical protein B0H34DRAFT_508921 [Crassisporium funariophilum]